MACRSLLEGFKVLPNELALNFFSQDIELENLNLKDILDLWLVIEDNDETVKIIKNSSAELVGCEITAIARSKIPIQELKSSDGIGHKRCILSFKHGDVPFRNMAFRSHDKRKCHEFVVANGYKERYGIYVKQDVGEFGEVRDIMSNVTQPIFASLKGINSRMANMKRVVDDLHDMNVETFWTGIHDQQASPVKDKVEKADVDKAEAAEGETPKSKKKKKKKAKKVDDYDLDL
ncbi:unnamed protein product [Bursaphelenchus okinawaensis]|uniref:Uncharacterized protein n=1 Tax=Bursaphelenchus okinawaensis TaxID=465554 RepID=A0A811LRV5_9BILA|nr:unnamed protein product [Bursaphelenchus okinawaensis]CAG9127247.1 unnamed protein product [Bursaphelenchus okinawaensis]